MFFLKFMAWFKKKLTGETNDEGCVACAVGCLPPFIFVFFLHTCSVFLEKFYEMDISQFFVSLFVILWFFDMSVLLAIHVVLVWIKEYRKSKDSS